MPIFPERVYPILDRDAWLKAGVSPAIPAALWRRYGLFLIQIRAKGLDRSAYEALAEEFRRDHPDFALIANDHLESALGRPDLFRGIHLGQEDIRDLREADSEYLSELRRRLEADPEFVAGISTHNIEQFRLALADSTKWSYIAVGPVAPTSSKPTGVDPVIPAAELRLILEEHEQARLAASELQRNSPVPPELVLIGGISAAFRRDLIVPGTGGENLGPIVASIGAVMTESGLNDLLVAGQECLTRN